MRYLAILIVIAVATAVRSEFCNICHTSGHACDTESSYMICSKGRMVGESKQCDYGMNCTTSRQICGYGIPACSNRCGKCNEDFSIACMGPSQYALCYGKSYPSKTVVNCPPNLICNNYLAGEFCVPQTDGFQNFVEPTCSRDITGDRPGAPVTSVAQQPPRPPPQQATIPQYPGAPSMHQPAPSHQQPVMPHQPPPSPSHQQPGMSHHQQPSPSHHQPGNQMHQQGPPPLQPGMSHHQPGPPSHHQPGPPPSHQMPGMQHHQQQQQPVPPQHHQLGSPMHQPGPPMHQPGQQHQQQLPHQQPPHQQPQHQQPQHQQPQHQQPQHQQPQHQQPQHQQPPHHQQQHHMPPQQHHQQPQQQPQPPQHMPQYTTPPPQTTTYAYPMYTSAPVAPTTPVPTGPVSPQQTCSSHGRPGRYAVSGSQCRSYYYCYVTSGSLTGQELKCPGTTIFNPDIQKCVAADTYTCAGGVPPGSPNVHFV